MMNTDPNHKHTFDEHGKMTCCSLEEKVNTEAEQRLRDKGLSTRITLDDLKDYAPAIISFILLISAIVVDNFIEQNWFSGYVRLIWYVVSYLPVGIPVIIDAGKAMLKKDIFSEFFLLPEYRLSSLPFFHLS